MGIAGCHPYDLRYCTISSGWHDVIWALSHPDQLAPGRISPGWLLDTAVNWYLIRISYDNVIMASGRHTLPFLNHPDEKANFDFPHHVVALQRFNKINRPPVNSSHRGQWRGALMFSSICAWINAKITNWEADYFRGHRTHYDVTVMAGVKLTCVWLHEALQSYNQVHNSWLGVITRNLTKTHTTVPYAQWSDP